MVPDVHAIAIATTTPQPDRSWMDDETEDGSN
jgi:hypothetical protein